MEAFSTIYWTNGVCNNKFNSTLNTTSNVIYVGIIIPPYGIKNPKLSTTSYLSKLCSIDFNASSPILNCNYNITWNTDQYSIVFLNETKIVLEYNYDSPKTICLQQDYYLIDEININNMQNSMICTNPVVNNSIIKQVTNGNLVNYTFLSSLNYTGNCLYKSPSNLDAVFPSNNFNVWLLDPIDNEWSNWLVIAPIVNNTNPKIIACPRRPLDPFSNGS